MDGRTIRAALEFAIPRDAPPSDLAASKPVYWELALVVEDLRAPYRAEFFVVVAATQPTVSRP